MPKILLAEDDANLREIFEMRLKAEGYEVLTAGDGEEALVVATHEKPDLMVVDIMMPKISGFEMLETLRANPDTSHIKAVMMTALGQAEDRERGEHLGVLKYLVKSQVTLEDFVRTIREILGSNQNNDQQRSNMDDQTNQAPAMPPADNNNPNPAPATPPAEPTTPPAPVADGMSMAEEKAEVNEEINSFASQPATPPADSSAPVSPMPTTEPTAPVEPPVESPATPAPVGEPETPAEPSAPAPEPGTTVEPTTPTEQPPTA